MATFPFENIIRCTTDWSLANGGLAQNVFYVGTSAAAPVQQDLEDACVYMKRLYDTSYGGFDLPGVISEDVSIVQIIARTIDPANPLLAQLTVGINGEQTSEPLPLETSVVTTLYSELASRRGRGRTFLPGVAVVESDNGLLLQAARDALEGIYNGWIGAAPFGGFDITPLIYSTVNTTGRDNLSAVTRSVFHHQKRRNS